jgi:hypothetical protein
MGAAELGREFGDAGGPLLVGAVAASDGFGVGLFRLAAGLLAAASRPLGVKPRELERRPHGSARRAAWLS